MHSLYSFLSLLKQLKAFQFYICSYTITILTMAFITLVLKINVVTI